MKKDLFRNVAQNVEWVHVFTAVDLGVLRDTWALDVAYTYRFWRRARVALDAQFCIRLDYMATNIGIIWRSTSTYYQ